MFIKCTVRAEKGQILNGKQVQKHRERSLKHSVSTKTISEFWVFLNINSHVCLKRFRYLFYTFLITALQVLTFWFSTHQRLLFPLFFFHFIERTLIPYWHLKSQWQLGMKFENTIQIILFLSQRSFISHRGRFLGLETRRRQMLPTWRRVGPSEERLLLGGWAGMPP